MSAKIIAARIENPLYDVGDKVRHITRHSSDECSPAFVDVMRVVEDPLDWFSNIGNAVADKIKRES